MKVEVTLCMGSSCFSRGNEKVLSFLEDYIEEAGLVKTILLRGEHCMGDCASGPVISVDGKKYNGLLPEEAWEIVRTALEGKV
ncbi:MAG: (2Fe-2S) ferredoxin domain-containing protein [Spirochaetales bacterium]|nr:(2Fe-2S) ferredoxin domain-containing protein [Spirochaetales bacterium]